MVLFATSAEGRGAGPERSGGPLAAGLPGIPRGAADTYGMRTAAGDASLIMVTVSGG
jgi:hypothetical protein